MTGTQTFYLSRIIGNKVYSPDNKLIGVLKDLIADRTYEKPKITAVIIKSGKQIKYLEFNNWQFTKTKGQYLIKCNEIVEITEPNESSIKLVKHILDKQLVDTNGRKVVRVNDIRIAVVSAGAFLMAVDVGLEGLLRRIGIAKPLKALLRIFKIILPAKFVLWDEVETINFSRLDIHLSKTLSKLNTLHPSDLADIIEDLDRQTQIALFSSMDMERAADILEEMEPDEQADIIENLPVDMAADLLEKMPADEAADLLDELKDDKVEELLNEMDREASEEVRELMEYEDNEVGSLMSTDFLSFSKNQSISDVLSQLRRDKPESLYSLFVFDKKDRLIGTVSLRDLIISEPEIMLKDVMNTKFNYVHDNDKTKSLAEMISKYNLLAVPVVNQEMQMLGTVIVDDVLDELMD